MLCRPAKVAAAPRDELITSGCMEPRPPPSPRAAKTPAAEAAAAETPAAEAAAAGLCSAGRRTRSETASRYRISTVPSPPPSGARRGRLPSCSCLARPAGSGAVDGTAAGAAAAGRRPRDRARGAERLRDGLGEEAARDTAAVVDHLAAGLEMRAGSAVCTHRESQTDPQIDLLLRSHSAAPREAAGASAAAHGLEDAPQRALESALQEIFEENQALKQDVIRAFRPPASNTPCQLATLPARNIPCRIASSSLGGVCVQTVPASRCSEYKQDGFASQQLLEQAVDAAERLHATVNALQIAIGQKEWRLQQVGLHMQSLGVHLATPRAGSPSSDLQSFGVRLTTPKPGQPSGSPGSSRLHVLSPVLQPKFELAADAGPPAAAAAAAAQSASRPAPIKLPTSPRIVSCIGPVTPPHPPEQKGAASSVRPPRSLPASSESACFGGRTPRTVAVAGALHSAPRERTGCSTFCRDARFAEVPACHCAAAAEPSDDSFGPRNGWASSPIALKGLPMALPPRDLSPGYDSLEPLSDSDSDESYSFADASQGSAQASTAASGEEDPRAFV